MSHDLRVRRSLKLVLLVWLAISATAFGDESQSAGHAKDSKAKVVYPKKTQLDFEGAAIEGEIQNPGEFYFEHRPEEKFDSLIKRRKNFHREMMRDVVFSK